MPHHQLSAIGGMTAAAIYSGGNLPGLNAAPGATAVGSDVVFCSGPGRLASILPHQLLASGVGITFYDANVPVSGGPLYSSGHIPLAFIPANLGLSTYASGVVIPANLNNIAIGMPFRYGLCVNSRSGQPGFTVSWSMNNIQSS